MPSGDVLFLNAWIFVVPAVYLSSMTRRSQSRIFSPAFSHTTTSWKFVVSAVLTSKCPTS